MAGMPRLCDSIKDGIDRYALFHAGFRSDYTIG